MKITGIGILLILTLMLCACGKTDGPDLTESGAQTTGHAQETTIDADDSQSAKYDMEKIYTDEAFRKIMEGEVSPVIVIYGLGGEGGYISATSKDPEVIKGFIEAFRDIKINRSTDNPDEMDYVMDGGEDIVFGLEDGSQVNLSLDGRNRIHANDVVYFLDNTQRLSDMCVMMQDVAYLNEAGGVPEEGYMAVIHGGVGERTVETYVYETDKGYRYINVVSTTVSWGSPKWKHEVVKIGTAASKEELINQAKNHGADSFVTFPGDPDAHPVSEF